jgi:aspartate 4-decarboxylase
LLTFAERGFNRITIYSNHQKCIDQKLGSITYKPINISSISSYAKNCRSLHLLLLIQFKTVDLLPDEEDEWQYQASELDKLRDPAVKAFFLVNPGNPSGYAIRPNALEYFANFVKTERPDLIIITDDVYGTFVNGFRSLMAVLPSNTIGVYSYSKYFGCTGWRLGVIAIHEDNVFDKKIAELPEADRQALNERYGKISLHPENLKFIDRMVADSRQIALNHTAGLSLPQQVQMVLFSLLSLMDSEDRYRQSTLAILQKRLAALYRGMGIEYKPSDLYDCYYRTLDFELWMTKNYGEELVNFVKATYEPVDIVFRLAEQFSTVLLNGSGFDAPDWSARVSLANLTEADYEKIGQDLHAIASQYIEEWEASKT